VHHSDKSYNYICFIDESGDEGFSFGQGSSEWFIISALVIKNTEEKAVVDLIAEIKSRLKWPANKPLHWRKLHHIEKDIFAEQIGKYKWHIATVAVCKPDIREKEFFGERYRLYFYCARYLLERVSWLVRDELKKTGLNTGKVKFIFSNRSNMSFGELKDYFNVLKRKSELNDIDIRIEWKYIDFDLIEVYTPGKQEGLQIADAIAGIFWAGFETILKKGCVFDYAKKIKGLIYNYQQNCWGYGLKIMPAETQKKIESGENNNWRWCLEEYVKK